MAPQSIRGVYLPGIAAILEQMGYNTKRWRGVINDRSVTLVVDGFQRFYDKHHPKAERMKVAFGMDLAVRSQTVMRREGLCVRKFMDNISATRVIVGTTIHDNGDRNMVHDEEV